MELFKLLGTIAIDNANANKALEETCGKAKETAEGIGGVSESGNKTSSKFATAMGKVGSAAVKVGKVVATGIAAAGTAIGGVTVKALSAAGELEQNMGGSEAVFGDYAAKMQNTAKTAFSNMGLSASDFLGTANKMGALFQGAGFGIEESATMSADAMQRAADVASIMGIDTASAMEAIAGAAKGNFTMMDNLGVAMNDTTIQAYALSKGIDKSTSEMTNQEKIGLAMEMFMEKTAYAAGNYAKENETLAGSLGTAKAALSNFLSGAGTVEDVVSSFSNAANVIVKNVKTMFPALMTGITQLVNQLVPMIPPLLEQLLPSLISGATGLINGLVAAMPMIISALMSALPALIEGITSIINALIQALPQIIEALVSALPGMIPQLVNGIVSMIIMLCTMLPQIIQPIIDYLPQIIISIVNALMTNLPALIQGLIQMTIAIVAALPQIIITLVQAMPTIVQSLADGLLAAAPLLWEGVKSIFGGILDAISATVTGVLDTICGWFGTTWDAVLSDLKTAWDNICKVIDIAIRLIGSILDAAIQIITLPFRFIWENCKEYVFAAFEWIKDKISVAISFIKNLVQTGFEFVKAKIITPITEAKNKATSAIQNLRDGIVEKITAIKSKVTEIFNSIKDKMEKPIEKARDTIKGIVDKIKGFFSGMKISFPHIKLPHFSIKPSGWSIGDLLKGSIPKLGIDWYAKAMNNPMIMTSPTIFGYNPKTGNVMGGGEAGSEVVSGTNTLMNMIGDVVESKTAAQNERIIAVLISILNAILGGNQELLQALLADKTFAVGEREFARLVKQYA